MWVGSDMLRELLLVVKVAFSRIDAQVMCYVLLCSKQPKMYFIICHQRFQHKKSYKSIHNDE